MASSSKKCRPNSNSKVIDELIEAGMSDDKLNEDPVHDLMWKVFTNDLLWSNIFQDLNHTTMKRASLVCKYFWDKVQADDTFQNKSKFRLDSFICKDPHFSKTNDDETCLKWKHVNIQIDFPSGSFMDENNSPIFRNRLNNIETMELSDDFSNDVSQYIKVAPILKTILPITVSLKSITMDCFILGVEDLREALSSEDIKLCFGRLSGLHIVSSANRANSNHVGTIHVATPNALYFNLESLASISMKLKSFSWGFIDVSPKMCTKDLSNIVNLIERNRLTLTSLSLKLFIWRFDALKEITCPELKSLVVVARSKNSTVVHEFLKKQPLLETLDLEFMDTFPEEIIQTIQERSQKLEKLRLKTQSFSDDNKVRHHLSGMSQLLEVEIVDIGLSVDMLGFETEMSLPLTLAALPIGLKSLRLRRLCSGWDENCGCICKECGSIRRICCCSCGFVCDCTLTPMADLMIPRLQRFTNLTELKILNRVCSDKDDYWGGDEEDVINDEILQFIVTNMMTLKVLGFSNCQTVTDFGLTGCEPNGQQTGASIQNLLALRELTIKDCPKLTDAGLSCAIKFPNLIYVYLSVRLPNLIHNNLIKTENLIEIVKQNPRLETIVVHSSDKNVDKILIDANSNIVHVHNTHFQDCASRFPRSKGISREKYQDPNNDSEYDENHGDEDESEVGSSDDDDYFHCGYSD